MSWTPVDLTKLSPPDVVETLDYETIVAALLDDLQARMAASGLEFTALVESDPAYKLLEAAAYREVLLRQRINNSAQAVMLAYSSGLDLDQLGANFSTERLVVTPADDTTDPPTEAVMETDAAYRERIQQAFEGLSVAGPRAAYERHARSADGRVVDAKAISPNPTEVVVSILANEGDGTAPADLLALVNTALSDEDVRPVGDRLTVQSAEIMTYTIRATAYLDPGPEAEPILAAVQEAADAYRTVKKRIGRDVNRSAITAALHVEGISKIVLDLPAADIPISDTQAGYCIGIEIINGGVSG